MAIPPAGTFAYTAIVPSSYSADGFECRVTSRDLRPATGDDLFDQRLVGTEALLRVTDGGLTPDSGPTKPWVMRSRILFTAATRQNASIAAAAFHVDKGLIAGLKPGDVMHFNRTGCGGLGLSVLRNGQLVVAVGAVVGMPLGDSIQVRSPNDLIDRAEGVFRERDADFAFAESPVEIVVDGRSTIAFRGRRQIGDFTVFIVHGHLHGLPGTDPCVAVCRSGASSVDAASASALLLDDPGALSMSR
jgi:hypothetical protein